MKNIKFLHTADLHIGASRKIPDYLKRQENMLKQILNIIEKNNCDFVLLSGDIYDREDVTTKERDLFLKYLFKIKIPVYIINGQHDIVGHDYTQMTLLNELKEKSNIHVTTLSPDVMYYKDWSILAIPYIKNVNTKKFNSEIRKLIPKIKDKNKVLGMFHGMVKGAKTETDFALPGGVSLSKKIPVKYWALGDIHKFQKMTKNALYCGSPIQHNFGEIETKRGVILVEIEDKKISIKRKKIKVKPLLSVNLEETDEIPEEGHVRVISAPHTIHDNLPDNVVKNVKTVPDKEFSFKEIKGDRTDISNLVKEKIKEKNYKVDSSLYSLLDTIIKKY